MPQVYRRHSENVQRPPPEPRRRSSLAAGPQLTDADDSIVLSDLVRTGEASRLRRRGAMRLDHGLSGAPRPLSTSALPPIGVIGPPQPSPGRPFALPAQPTRPLTPPWAMGNAARDETQDMYADIIGEDPSDASGTVALDEQRRVGEHEDDEESFVLHCGGEIAKVPPTDYSRPYTPSPLPLPPSSASTSSHGRVVPRTNGCGAVIHLRAFPQKTRGVWVGKREATEAVVAMDSVYFERSIVARMMKSACGCVREGVGCAVCGNPLGTRYMPCQAASEGIFTARHKQSTPPRPSRPQYPAGPQYYAPARASSLSRSHHADASGRLSSSTFYVYTFFADHVSSLPACPFPAVEKTEHQPIVSSPLRPTTWLGPTPSASPRSYSPPFAVPSTPEPAPIEPLNAMRRAPPRRDSVFFEPPPGSGLAEEDWMFISPEVARGFDGDEVDAGEGGFDDDDDDRVSVDMQLRGVLDADGVFVEPDVANDPDSPDKTETVTWPGR
ncbi:uncharacterized protein PHACADRAFT_248700 [Phanerochaete carnosa HHB-10118-sp]|uniref:Uncharacterized protein n=1 Tax=Phanerochaete carnosa (strain HHB-10118-sp) TaxID=650164 RepID=K5WRH5_PHACS|nr:uncharacterized protein PHACADRAFT_248700 [Phanerochaete carnosa HHB-10118-sp]EKM61834.1 hypothetical protein PHACADRAFT_248700 [Phanerochaete carnosa HHB-10118-sp]